MADPVDLRGRVEMTTPFAGPDANEIELAFMVRSFSALQGAGLIPSGRVMGDRLTAAQQKALAPLAHEKGSNIPTTYEAALRLLVTDADRNGRLDLDVDQLVASKLLASDASPRNGETLAQRTRTALLEGNNQEIDSAFFLRQEAARGAFSSATRFVDGHEVNGLGQRINQHLRGMRLVSGGPGQAPAPPAPSSSGERMGPAPNELRRPR